MGTKNEFVRELPGMAVVAELTEDFGEAASGTTVRARATIRNSGPTLTRTTEWIALAPRINDPRGRHLELPNIYFVLVAEITGMKIAEIIVIPGHPRVFAP